MTWKHFPRSPWGNVDICEHGNIRLHGSTERECIYCDFPEDAKPILNRCPKCKALTWHLDNMCLRCKNEGEKDEDTRCD